MLKRALVVAALLVGCGSSNAAYDASMSKARDAYGAGRFADAAKAFDDASKATKNPKDAVFARYEAALAKARAGDIATAGKELAQLANENVEYSDQAAMSHAELVGRDDEAGMYRELEALCLKFPNSAQARVALEKLIRHDDAAALPLLEAMAPKVAGTELEDDVLYERAKRLEAAGQHEKARDSFEDVANRWPYPKGAFFDDSLYRAAQIEEGLKRPKEAIALLERLLSFREQSVTIGSYERPRYVPAMLLIAKIQEQDLNDRAAARETYHRLYRDFTTSTERDDALWKEAQLWSKDNDASTACDRLATLASDFPDSRYVPCAVEKCPSIKPDAKGKAPKTCHAYLTRE